MADKLRNLDADLGRAVLDLAFLRGRLEDAPTKDWVNGKLSQQTTLILSVMGVGFTAIAILVAVN